MKTSIYYILSLGLLIVSCSAQKKLVKDAPADFSEAVFKEWYGGREDSGVGFLLELSMVENDQSIVWENAFFRGGMAPIEVKEKNNGMVLVAKFINQAKNQSNAKDTPETESNEDIDFTSGLGDTEAILSFSKEGKTKYFKVTDIKQGKPLIYR